MGRERRSNKPSGCSSLKEVLAISNLRIKSSIDHQKQTPKVNVSPRSNRSTKRKKKTNHPQKRTQRENLPNPREFGRLRWGIETRGSPIEGALPRNRSIEAGGESIWGARSRSAEATGRKEGSRGRVWFGWWRVAAI